jgi:hypothetical protein
MSSYTVRNIDWQLWKAASDKAHAAGSSLKVIIEKLLREWLQGDSQPS